MLCFGVENAKLTYATVGLRLPQNSKRIIAANKNARSPFELTSPFSRRASSETRGLLKLLPGWQVHFDASGELLGNVDEVLLSKGKKGVGQPLLRVIRQVPNRDHRPLREQHLIPFVRDIVTKFDREQHKLFITPPEGLLDLGRRQLQLAVLKEELLPYTAPAQSALAAEVGIRCMPTQKQLKLAGRHDIIRSIQQVGGFPEVALQLGLQCNRRPSGYWDNPSNLDRELSLFVAAHWWELPAGDEGELYYYNQVSGRILWQRPTVPEKIPLADDDDLIVEDEEDRVMPSRTSVLAAGRFDLHHAIVYNGGYTAVAQQLDRRPSWPRNPHLRDMDALNDELFAFLQESGQDEGQIPSMRQLQEAGRTDLISAIMRAGGFVAAAQKMGLQSRRHGRHKWRDVETVVDEFRNFLASKEGCEFRHLPTQKQLNELGRHDLRYALQLHGSSAVAQKLGIPQLKRKIKKK